LEVDTCIEFLEGQYNHKVLTEEERERLSNLIYKAKVELEDAESWANDVEGYVGFAIRDKLQSLRYILEELGEAL